MTNLNVRRSGGEMTGTPAGEEPLRWVHWDPFRQMAPFLAGEERQARFTPAFEIRETEEGFVFKADVPGIEEKNIDITMTGNRLTISGTRAAEQEKTADIFYARECSYGGFTRAFTLPEGTDGKNGIQAELDRGVLTLFLPKAPEQQPRRIEVKVAGKPKPQK
jgi:HSP20 family protein